MSTRSWLVKSRRWPYLKMPTSPSAVCVEQNTSYLDLLPVELFEIVLEHLIQGKGQRQRNVFCLAATCKRFRNMLNQSVLYETLVVNTKKQAVKLLKSLHKHKSNAGLVKTLCYVHPDDDSGSRETILQTGYSFGSMGNMDRPTPDLILDLIALMTNLETVYFDEMVPNFKFPAVLRDSKVTQTICDRPNGINVHLSPEPGWSFVLNIGVLWAFGSMKTLHLSNCIVKDESLPEKFPRVSRLILSGCDIRCQDMGTFHAAFTNVDTLIMDNLRSIDETKHVIFGLPKLKLLTLGLVGRMSPQPVHDDLLPATSLIPILRQPPYSPSTNTPSKQTDLCGLQEVLKQIASKLSGLTKLQLVLPKRCLLSSDDPNFDKRTAISESIGLLAHIPTTIIVSPHF